MENRVCRVRVKTVVYAAQFAREVEFSLLKVRWTFRQAMAPQPNYLRDMESQQKTRRRELNKCTFVIRAAFNDEAITG
jgi:hypothetical protein